MQSRSLDSGKYGEPSRHEWEQNMKKTLLALASIAVFGSASAIAGSLTCYTAPTMPYGFCFDPTEITAVGSSLYAVRLGMSTPQGVGDTGATLTVNCQTRAMQAW